MAKSKKRQLFGEMMEAVRAMRAHRGGRIMLRSHRIERSRCQPSTKR